MIEKLILGTAGLGGLPYGRNKRVVAKDEAIAVIRRAVELGITAFDTAPAYGEAESWLGKAIENEISDRITVYTKTRGSIPEAMRSMERLCHLPVFLWHNWKVTEAIPAWTSGVTAYYDSAEYITGSDCIVQGEWNLLNQEWTKSGRKAKTFIARSVFLQGVLAGEPAPDEEVAEYVARAQRFADSAGMHIRQLALTAALENPLIDGAVIGPTTIEELEECVVRSRIRFGTHPSVRMLAAAAPSLVDPRQWDSACPAS